MTRDVPRFAAWLLQQFASGPNGDNVAGDITERYEAGSSRLWYWWQVVVAIFMSLAREIRTHTALALRGLLIGWVLGLMSYPLQRRLTQFWVIDNPWIGPTVGALVFVLINCIFTFGLGWLLGRLHKPHHAKMVMLFVVSWFALLIPTFFVFLGKALRDWPFALAWYDYPYYLALGVVGNLLAMLCTLAGGLLSVPRAPDEAHTTRA